MTRRIIYGAGGHGRVIASIARRQGIDGVVFVDELRAGEVIDGHSVIAADLGDLLDRADSLVILALGDSPTRARRRDEALGLGFGEWSVMADPSLVYSDAIGPGAMILPGAVVNAGARIGASVIVNTNATVEHDCVLGDYCHLAPGAVLASAVELGPHVWIGANATVLPGLSVVGGTTIGSGAVVTRSITQRGVYAGVPARPIAGRSGQKPGSKG